MTEQELREKNQRTVERFFQLHGTDRLVLFTEDGAKTIPFNPSFLKRFSWRGKEALRANFEFNKGDLKSWEFKNMKIIPAQDPNFFTVTTTGEGVKNDGYEYKNYYLFTFEMEEGLIKEVTEYTNPINGMVAGGFEIPKEYAWDETAPFMKITTVLDMD